MELQALVHWRIVCGSDDWGERGGGSRSTLSLLGYEILYACLINFKWARKLTGCVAERLCHAVVTKGKTLYVIGGSMKDKANKNLYPESWTVEMGIATVPATTAAPQRMVASPLKSPPKSAPLPRKAAAGAGKRSRPQAKSRPKAAARKASPVEQEQEANKSCAPLFRFNSWSKADACFCFSLEKS